MKIDEFEDEVYKNGYKDAINDFAKELKEYYKYYDLDYVFEDNESISYSNCVSIFERYVDDIARQIKSDF